MEHGEKGVPCKFCGGPVPPSRSRNKKQVRDFCCCGHKNAYGVEARKVGRRLLAVGMDPGEREAFLETLRKIGPGRIIVRDPAAREARRKRQEYVDLDAMLPQERLGALCRAAERWGVMK